MNDDYDEMRKKLGVDDLEDEDQKELYDKFVDAGGVAESDRQKIRRQSLHRAKEERVSKKSGSRQSSKKSTKKAPVKKTKRPPSKKTVSQRSKGRVIPLSTKISLYIKGVWNGVLNFNGKTFKPSFLSMIKTDVQTHLINIYAVIDDLKQYSPDLSILEDVFDESPLSWELLERMKTMYNGDEWDQYIVFYNTAIKTQVKPENIYKFLAILFKRIYTFYDHSSRTVEAVDMVYQMILDRGKLDEDVKKSNVKKVKDAIDFLMYTFLPKLVIAYSVCAQKVWTLDQLEGLRVSLGFKSEDIVGYMAEEKKKERAKMKARPKSTVKSADEEIEEEEETQEEEDEKELPENLLKGKGLVDSMSFIANKENKGSRSYYFDDDDPVFHIMKLMDFLDREFSFIFTSKKIQIRVDYHEGNKVDVKSELNERYFSMTEVQDWIDEIIEYQKELKDIKNNPALNYVQKEIEKENFEIKINSLTYKIKTKLKEDLTFLDEKLKYLLSNKSALLSNPNIKLSFESIEGKRKLEGKSINEALSLAESFIGYFHYLITEGYLADKVD